MRPLYRILPNGKIIWERNKVSISERTERMAAQLTSIIRIGNDKSEKVKDSFAATYWPLDAKLKGFIANAN